MRRGGREHRNEKKRLNSKKRERERERRKPNQAGKWQELLHAASMFFICDTAMVSGTRKDKGVRHRITRRRVEEAPGRAPGLKLYISHPRGFRQQGLKLAAASAAWQLM